MQDYRALFVELVERDTVDAAYAARDVKGLAA